MFNEKLGLSVEILRQEIKVQRDNMHEQWRLYEELRKKVNGLYIKDVHDTERPRVDILADEINNEVWNDLHLLRSRIIELEEKK